jgi:hypothetical protein
MKSVAPETEKVEKQFEELKAKVAQAIEIKPDAKYLLVFRKGVLDHKDMDIFQQLWRQNFGTAMVMAITGDPEKDIKVLEIK